MMNFLLAALIGAAQEVIVVYESATTSHNVVNHPGSSYNWGVYINLGPNTEAPPDDYIFKTSNGTNTIQVQWKNAGIYYLQVTEADISGCENTKVLPVNVIFNERSIGFLTATDSACFNSEGNGFDLPLKITGNDSQALPGENFPLVLEFTLNGKEFTQQISFDNQVIKIQDDWLDDNPQTNFNVEVEIISARDIQNNEIKPDLTSKTHVSVIQALPQIEFETLNPIVEQGSEITYSVKMLVGNPENSVYHWSLNSEAKSTTDLSLIKEPSATILWNEPPGNYLLQVSVTDGNGCISETISQQIQIIVSSEFYVSAGRDSAIGSCDPFQLQATFEQQPGDKYTILWSPATNLDDPTKPNPVFTPGSNTIFTVTVTNSNGISDSDTVKITVSDLLAEAGDDVFMLTNTNAILDGSGSAGKNLSYQWTTSTGKIESGANTANPIVSGFGWYLLEVTDEYGCTVTDTMNVYRLEQAPVANDDYDTTAYRTETLIPVLINDTDPENSINPLTLKITSAPFNGTAYVDYDNYNIHYRPNDGFSGNEIFEYEICNTNELCDRAKVFVMVTEYRFVIPDAFTPNGDGINDFFEIIGIDSYPGNSITIINRWGNKVYEAKNYGIDTNPVFWDGNANKGSTFLGNELPTGAYYYVLDLGNGEKPISGSIYLDR